MTVMKLSALAAGVIGGAMALSGATPASAVTVAPALVQSGDKASVQQVTHDPLARNYNQRAWRGRDLNRYGNRFYRSGPAIGFGLSAPGFSFGIGTPAVRSYPYGYSQPYGYGGYGYGYGYPRYYGY